MVYYLYNRKGIPNVTAILGTYYYMPQYANLYKTIEPNIADAH